MPQSLNLAFPRRITLNSIYITFDTNLCLFQNLHLPNWRAPEETVRDYRIWYRLEGEWKTVGTFRDNFQRRPVHRFPRMEADEIKVEVLSTWGSKTAAVYEVRVYDE